FDGTTGDYFTSIMISTTGNITNRVGITVNNVLLSNTIVKGGLNGVIYLPPAYIRLSTGDRVRLCLYDNEVTVDPASSDVTLVNWTFFRSNLSNATLAQNK